jgi:hypothetical protein
VVVDLQIPEPPGAPRLSRPERPPLHVAFAWLCLWIVGCVVAYYLGSVAGSAAAASGGSWLSTAGLGSTMTAVASVILLLFPPVAFLAVLLPFDLRWAKHNRTRQSAIYGLWVAALLGLSPSRERLMSVLPAEVVRLHGTIMDWLALAMALTVVIVIVVALARRGRGRSGGQSPVQGQDA